MKKILGIVVLITSVSNANIQKIFRHITTYPVGTQLEKSLARYATLHLTKKKFSKIDYQKFFDAVTSNDICAVTSYVNVGIDVNYKLDGWSMLHECARHGHVEIAKLFIERGADMHAKYLQGTPLGVAIRFHQVAMVQLLINEGVDVNTICCFDLCPLQFALLNPNAKIIKLLVDAGAEC